MDARALLLVLFISPFLGYSVAQRNSNVCHGRSIDLCMSSLVSILIYDDNGAAAAGDYDDDEKNDNN